MSNLAFLFESVGNHTGSHKYQCVVKFSIFIIDAIIGFSPSDYTVVESVGQALLTVTVIEGVLTHAVAFSVSTSDGSAKGK